MFLLFAFFFYFIILRNRATSIWYQSITSIQDQIIILVPFLSNCLLPSFTKIKIPSLPSIFSFVVLRLEAPRNHPWKAMSYEQQTALPPKASLMYDDPLANDNPLVTSGGLPFQASCTVAGWFAFLWNTFGWHVFIQ